MDADLVGIDALIDASTSDRKRPRSGSGAVDLSSPRAALFDVIASDDERVDDLAPAATVLMEDHTVSEAPRVATPAPAAFSTLRPIGDRHMLKAWGVPDRIAEAYATRGVRLLYPWQADCLGTAGVLLEKAPPPGVGVNDAIGGAAATFTRPRWLLYCAPTSGGKTLVAEVCMALRLLQAPFGATAASAPPAARLPARGGRAAPAPAPPPTPTTRALFVLPYKALVDEKAAQLTRLLSPPGAPRGERLRVVALHGGKRAAGLGRARVVVCTMERAIGLVSSMIADGSIANLRCVVVDELHMLGDSSRGYCLEVLLATLLHCVRHGAPPPRPQLRPAAPIPAAAPSGARPSAAHLLPRPPPFALPSRVPCDVQVIGMSATLPNVAELAAWLDAALFTTDFRPVPLTEYLMVRDVMYRVRVNGELVPPPTRLQPPLQRQTETCPQARAGELLPAASAAAAAPAPAARAGSSPAFATAAVARGDTPLQPPAREFIPLLAVARVYEAAPAGVHDPDRVVTLVAETVRMHAQVLVFAATKADVEGCARMLARELPARLAAAPPSGPAPIGGADSAGTGAAVGTVLARRAAAIAAARLQLVERIQRASGGGGGGRLGGGGGRDSGSDGPGNLVSCIRAGVGFHHSGLVEAERGAVEAGFSRGTLVVLVATSTLAAGVNLPARRVIFRSPRIAMEDLDVVRYRQMSGRAGRAGRDVVGESIMLVPEPPGARRVTLAAHSALQTVLRTMRSDMAPAQSALVAATVATDLAQAVAAAGPPFLRPLRIFDGEADGLSRLLLQAVAAGIATTAGDLEAFVLSCALLPRQLGVAATAHCVSQIVGFLLQNEVVRVSLPSRGAAGGRGVRGDGHGDAQALELTELGRATVAARLSPVEGVLLYYDLRRAQCRLVLDDPLHLLFAVAAPAAPVHGCDPSYRGVDPTSQWATSTAGRRPYAEQWARLPPRMRNVGELVGIEPPLLMAAKQSSFTVAPGVKFTRANALNIAEEDKLAVDARLRARTAAVRAATGSSGAALCAPLEATGVGARVADAGAPGSHALMSTPARSSSLLLAMPPPQPEPQPQPGRLLGASSASSPPRRLSAVTDRDIAVHRRFYLALLLRELVNDMEPAVLAAREGLAPAAVIALAAAATAFAGAVERFSTELHWPALAALAALARKRVSGHWGRDVAFMRGLDGVTRSRAAVLRDAGLDSLRALADADVGDLDLQLARAEPFSMATALAAAAAPTGGGGAAGGIAAWALGAVGASGRPNSVAASSPGEERRDIVDALSMPPPQQQLPQQQQQQQQARRPPAQQSLASRIVAAARAKVQDRLRERVDRVGRFPTGSGGAGRAGGGAPAVETRVAGAGDARAPQATAVAAAPCHVWASGGPADGGRGLLGFVLPDADAVMEANGDELDVRDARMALARRARRAQRAAEAAAVGAAAAAVAVEAPRPAAGGGLSDVLWETRLTVRAAAPVDDLFCDAGVVGGSSGGGPRDDNDRGDSSSGSAGSSDADVGDALLGDGPAVAPRRVRWSRSIGGDDASSGDDADAADDLADALHDAALLPFGEGDIIDDDEWGWDGSDPDDVNVHAMDVEGGAASAGQGTRPRARRPRTDGEPDDGFGDDIDDDDDDDGPPVIVDEQFVDDVSVGSREGAREHQLMPAPLAVIVPMAREAAAVGDGGDDSAAPRYAVVPSGNAVAAAAAVSASESSLSVPTTAAIGSFAQRRVALPAGVFAVEAPIVAGVMHAVTNEDADTPSRDGARGSDRAATTSYAIVRPRCIVVEGIAASSGNGGATFGGAVTTAPPTAAAGPSASQFSLEDFSDLQWQTPEDVRARLLQQQHPLLALQVPAPPVATTRATNSSGGDVAALGDGAWPSAPALRPPPHKSATAALPLAHRDFPSQAGVAAAPLPQPPSRPPVGPCAPIPGPISLASGAPHSFLSGLFSDAACLNVLRALRSRSAFAISVLERRTPRLANAARWASLVHARPATADELATPPAPLPTCAGPLTTASAPPPAYPSALPPPRGTVVVGVAVAWGAGPSARAYIRLPPLLPPAPPEWRGPRDALRSQKRAGILTARRSRRLAALASKSGGDGGVGSSAAAQRAPKAPRFATAEAPAAVAAASSFKWQARAPHSVLVLIMLYVGPRRFARFDADGGFGHAGLGGSAACDAGATVEARGGDLYAGYNSGSSSCRAWHAASVDATRAVVEQIVHPRWSALRSALSALAPLKVLGEDGKRTLATLARHGAHVAGELFDVVVADWLLDPQKSADADDGGRRAVGVPGRGRAAGVVGAGAADVIYADSSDDDSGSGPSQVVEALAAVYLKTGALRKAHDTFEDMRSCLLRGAVSGVSPVVTPPGVSSSYVVGAVAGGGASTGSARPPTAAGTHGVLVGGSGGSASPPAAAQTDSEPIMPVMPYLILDPGVAAAGSPASPHAPMAPVSSPPAGVDGAGAAAEPAGEVAAVIASTHVAPRPADVTLIRRIESWARRTGAIHTLGAVDAWLDDAADDARFDGDGFMLTSTLTHDGRIVRPARCLDRTTATWALAVVLGAALREWKLDVASRFVEMPLVRTLADMERCGVGVELYVLRRAIAMARERLNVVESAARDITAATDAELASAAAAAAAAAPAGGGGRSRRGLGGRSGSWWRGANLRSPSYVAAVTYSHLGAPLPDGITAEDVARNPHVATALASTAALTALTAGPARQPPVPGNAALFADLVVEHRRLTSLLACHVLPLRRAALDTLASSGDAGADGAGPRVFPTISFRTVTGRLVTSRPNLQCLPKATDIRRVGRLSLQQELSGGAGTVQVRRRRFGADGAAEGRPSEAPGGGDDDDDDNANAEEVELERALEIPQHARCLVVFPRSSYADTLVAAAQRGELPRLEDAADVRPDVDVDGAGSGAAAARPALRSRAALPAAVIRSGVGTVVMVHHRHTAADVAVSAAPRAAPPAADDARVAEFLRRGPDAISLTTEPLAAYWRACGFRYAADGDGGVDGSGGATADPSLVQQVTVSLTVGGDRTRRPCEAAVPDGADPTAPSAAPPPPPPPPPARTTVSLTFPADRVYRLTAPTFIPSRAGAGQAVWATDATLRLRDAIVARPGHVLLSADYAQMELRVLASISRDPDLRAALAPLPPGDAAGAHDSDVFRRLTAAWHGRPPSAAAAVTDEERAHTKALVYGMMYGMGPQRLAERMGLADEAAAKAFAHRFHAMFAGATKFLTKDVATAFRAQGYVTTLLGRRRYLPGANSADASLVRKAQRAAINTVCQGSAADIIKLAMSNVAYRLAQLPATMGDGGGGAPGPPAPGAPPPPPPPPPPRVLLPNGLRPLAEPAARIVLQIHDELLLEVRDDALPAVARIVRDCMEGAIALDGVALRVTLSVGNYWGSLKAYDV